MNTNNDASSASVLNIAIESTYPLDVEIADTLEHGSEETFQQSSKYYPYFLRVDPEQDDRANEIKLCSMKRPHMRAFHFSWWCYHVAFLMWWVGLNDHSCWLHIFFFTDAARLNRFSITPLLKEVQNTLKISDAEIWTSSISASIGTIIMRFLLGPYCDKYGPRIPMGIVLFCSACPTALTGFVNSAAGLSVLRFFIGVGGSTFVMCQYWWVSSFDFLLWCRLWCLFVFCCYYKL